jgi:CheY-like chemotaxis protein
MIKVLLIDDDDIVRKTLARYLSLNKYEVQSAGNSKEAFRIVESFSPDVLVVDWMLGDSVNGDELAAQLREDIPKLPAIIISGYPDAKIGSQAPGEATTRVLAKPFRPAMLVDMLKELVQPAGLNSTQGE